MRREPNSFHPWVAVFTFLVMVAILLTLSAPDLWAWQNIAAFLLDGIVLAIAPLVLMVAVNAAFQGLRMPMWESLRAAAPWISRYLWTNAHTTVVFWVPVESLVLLAHWQARLLPAPSALGIWVSGLWTGLVLSVALFLHARTSLAPYLAIHSNLPGTLAVMVSFRLTAGREFWRALGVILSSISIPLVVSALVIGGLFLLPVQGLQWIRHLGPQLLGLEIMAIRIFLVPALHSLYEELFQGAGLEATNRGVPELFNPLLWLSDTAARGARLLPVVRRLVATPAKTPRDSEKLH